MQQKLPSRRQRLKEKLSIKTGLAVIGAAVGVKGTNNRTVTDIDGNFELDAKVGDILEITYVGHKPITIAATAEPMNITMVEDSKSSGRSDSGGLLKHQ